MTDVRIVEFSPAIAVVVGCFKLENSCDLNRLLSFLLGKQLHFAGQGVWRIGGEICWLTLECDRGILDVANQECQIQPT